MSTSSAVAPYLDRTNPDRGHRMGRRDKNHPFLRPPLLLSGTQAGVSHQSPDLPQPNSS